MKTAEEIRLENLDILIAEAGGVTRLAEKTGKAQAQISQLKNQSKSGTGVPKLIGAKQAREIEKAMNRERGWMDHEHNPSALPIDTVERFVQLYQETTDQGRKVIEMAMSMAEFELNQLNR